MAIALVAALLIAAQSPALPSAETATPVRPIRASKIVLVGDSTTAVIGGWGPSFCAHHVTSTLACVNLGRGGRSTSNYRAEGSWELALAEIGVPGYAATWVLIQFGHNDQPGKPGRSTDLATEYPANLRRYIAEARAAGARPVLVTPLTRRQFRDGQLQNDLAPWAEATRRVAAEERVPLVDLNARSVALVQAMGPMVAARLAQMAPSPEVAAAALTGTTVPASTGVAPTPQPVAAQNAAAEPMGQARLSFDYTHLGRDGADAFAAIVAAELAIAVPELRRLLVP
jgi:lysophospholipase L1-like esterase